MTSLVLNNWALTGNQCGSDKPSHLDLHGLQNEPELDKTYNETV